MTLVTIGMPSLLLIGGAWSFAAVVNRWVGPLSGPPSWAAGVLIEVTLLSGESAFLGLVYPHPHPQIVDVVTLLVPLALALGAYWQLTRVRRPRIPRSQRVSGEPWLAAMVVVLIEAMFEVIKLHGHDYGLTWFMGGDARNHVVGNRQIMAAGGITLQQITKYPVLVNALNAILDGASGRANLTTSVLMLRDIQALIATVIMSCIGIALFFMAAVAEAFPRGLKYVQRLPLYLVIPLATAASLGVGAFVQGLAASGGFLSAIGCLAFATASLVLGMRIVNEYNDFTLFLLTVSMVVVLVSWTFLFVVPVALLLIAYVAAWRHVVRRRRQGQGARELRLSLWVIAFSVLCLVGVTGALLLNQATLVAQLKTDGGIVPAAPRLFDWLGIATVLAVATAPNARQRMLRLVPVAAFAVSGITVWLMYRMHPGGLVWSYYATKMLWMATATIIWVPFMVLVDVVRISNQLLSRFGWRGIVNICLSTSGSWGILAVIGHETPFSFIMTWAYKGSTFPSPQVISLVLQQADIPGHFVVWDFSTPFNDQVGNFWSALAWDYTPNATVIEQPGVESFVNWAASGDYLLSGLCAAVTDYHTRVVTPSVTVLHQLSATCPAYRRHPSYFLVPS